MSAARYHRRTDDDTAISSINRLYYPQYGSKYYSTIILFVVDTTFRKYYPTHFQGNSFLCLQDCLHADKRQCRSLLQDFLFFPHINYRPSPYTAQPHAIPPWFPFYVTDFFSPALPLRILFCKGNAGDCSNTKSSIAFDRKIFLCVQSVFSAPDLVY